MAVKTDRKFWLYDDYIYIPAQEWADMDAEVLRLMNANVCKVNKSKGHESACACSLIYATEVVSKNKKIMKARERAESIIAEKPCRCNSFVNYEGKCELCDDWSFLNDDWENIVNTLAYEFISN